MRWAFVIEQKLKVAALLLGIMVTVVLFSFIERRNIEAINNSVASIYNDRLVPATDIFYLTETTYNKRLEMEKLLFSGKMGLQAFRGKEEEHNRAIKTLVASFQKTYLVNEEDAFLKGFIRKTEQYFLVEEKIVALVAAGDIKQAIALYENQGQGLLKESIHNLSALAKIQTKVGNELMKDSKGIMASSDLLSTLQMSVVIVLGVLIVVLVTASKLVSPHARNFNLN